MPHSLKVRLKNLKHQGLLSEKDVDRLISALEQRSTIEKLTEGMREVTPEESKSIEEYLSRTSKKTGVNIFDLEDVEDEIDFVQEHKKIPVTLNLQPCEDAISRDAVLEYLKSNVDDFPDYHEAIEKVLVLPSVTVRQTKSHTEKVTHHKCKECMWLANEKTVIGRKCVNPHKVWKSRTAMWHQPSCKACKMFKPYKEEGVK